ncbi:LysR family transcriptional regulator [Gynuella sunshinyii]|uniref:Transcriptional regulator n=1 Tax=Gynuella sunshinyii YC6258 TaxID=1445510 RepID=A0A0C5VHB6_9GAMM|nr:LysR family transcriptional regulator [Gynuella sunshinyii]AJQ94052.1 transcriptional regulator [Gynuella sunshinyii YC6258]
MKHNIDWNDLRYLLLVARHGSVSAAARELGVNHTTVLRRINSFEEANKLRFFIKKSTGYKPTPEGLQLLEAACAVEEKINDLERKIKGAENEMSGQVRITAVDSLCHPLLLKHINSFTHSFPEIEVLFSATNQVLDLGNRDSDIAVRPGLDLPEHLHGYRVADMACHVYLHEALSEHDPDSLPWLGLDRPISTTYIGQQYEQMIQNKSVAFRANSFKALQMAAEQLAGCTLLPCFLGDTSDSLQRLPGSQYTFTTGLWVVSHKDLALSKPISRLMEHIHAGLQQDEDLFAGQRSRCF